MDYKIDISKIISSILKSPEEDSDNPSLRKNMEDADIKSADFNDISIFDFNNE